MYVVDAGSTWPGTRKLEGEQIVEHLASTTFYLQYCVGENLLWWFDGETAIVRHRVSESDPLPQRRMHFGQPVGTRCRCPSHLRSTRVGPRTSE